MSQPEHISFKMPDLPEGAIPALGICIRSGVMPMEENHTVVFVWGFQDGTLPSDPLQVVGLLEAAKRAFMKQQFGD